MHGRCIDGARPRHTTTPFHRPTRRTTSTRPDHHSVADTAVALDSTPSSAALGSMNDDGETKRNVAENLSNRDMLTMFQRLMAEGGEGANGISNTFLEDVVNQVWCGAAQTVLVSCRPSPDPNSPATKYWPLAQPLPPLPPLPPRAPAPPLHSHSPAQMFRRRRRRFVH